MKEYKRQSKFKKYRKYPGVRSIPLSNPVQIQWFKWGQSEGKLDGKRPTPRVGVSSESFAPSGIEHTKPPEPQPKFVLMHSLDTYTELRMCWLGTEYWYVEINKRTKKEWRSVSFHGRYKAMQAYDLHIAGVRGAIVWLRVQEGG